MRSPGFAIFSTVFAAVAAPLCAATVPTIDISPGRLAPALTTLGRQANVDILFSDALVGDRVTSGVRGQVEAAKALSQLLVGSGLMFHKTAEGVYIINRQADAISAQTPAADDNIPEILVVGRRAQNSDIRRTENDIQPYQVYTLLISVES